MTSATGSLRKAPRAFSLVELLVVIAIMAVLMGIIGLGIQGMRASALQTAAAQVSSGLSLARQVAITKNTMSTFIMATNTGPGLPNEPFCSWAIASWNKTNNNGNGGWVLEKDWEKLPEGTVFAQVICGLVYRTRTTNSWNSLTVGTPSSPGAVDFSQRPNANFIVRAGSSDLNLTQQATLTFTNTGEFVGGSGKFGIRLAEGSPTADGKITLRSINKYYFVEGGSGGSRVIVRSPETYR